MSAGPAEEFGDLLAGPAYHGGVQPAGGAPSRLVRRYGADASATEVDLFLSACLHGDRAAAERQLKRISLDELGDDEHAVTLSEDNEKPPSSEVADLLHDYGIGGSA